MSKKIDIIINAVDNMSSVVDGTTDSVQDLEEQIIDTANSGTKSNKDLRKSFENVTAGLAVAGAAMAAYSQSQKELFSSANQAAVGLGMTNKEFNNLAISVSNVTFPLNEAVDLLELAGKQGLQTEEDLANFATFWDTLGDASGESSLELAKMSTGLRSMGIAAGQESEALNAYGIILQNTSLDLVKFNEMTSKNSEIAKANGLTIDDLAATYSYMQNELGLTAEMMESQFETVLQSNMTEIQAYQQTLGDASGFVGELAGAHEESFTVFDKFKHGISELTLKYQEQIQLAGDFGSFMTGVSAALNLASKGQALYAASTAATGVAATTATPGLLGMAAATAAATWPILAVVAAIAAVIAIIVLVIKHFDKFTEAFKKGTNGIKSIAKAVFPILFAPMLAGIKVAVAAFKFLKDNWDTMLEALKTSFIILIDIITLPFKMFINGFISGINTVIRGANRLGANFKEIEKFDLSIGSMDVNRSSTQTININTKTELDGKEIAKSTAQTTRRVAASNNI